MYPRPVSKRSRHEFPGDTPVSQRRLGITDDVYIPPEHQRPKLAKPDHLCVWPECTERRSFVTMPLCPVHVGYVHETAKRLKWDETREEAITRTRRMEATRRRSERVWAREDRLSETRGAKPGWIYYLHIDGKVKIGYTTDIVKRMRSYPPSSPLLGVHPGTPELERQMHEQFRGSLIQGREWFRPDGDLLAHCERVRAQYGDPARFEYRARAPHETRQVTKPRAWRGSRPA